MSLDGIILRDYIDNQPKSKISIARDLEISKQTLFQYFKSSVLTPEIKKRFEDYFKADIFSNASKKQAVKDNAAMENVELPRSLEDLIYCTRRLSDSNYFLATSNDRNSLNIERLITLLEVSLGEKGKNLIQAYRDEQGKVHVPGDPPGTERLPVRDNIVIPPRKGTGAKKDK